MQAQYKMNTMDIAMSVKRLLNYKKSSLTRVQQPTTALFLCLVTFLWPLLLK